MQAYSNPKRESDPHALPDVEVWQDFVSIIHCSCGDYEKPTDVAHAEAVAYCPSCEQEAESIEDTERTAFWYWYCLPGCMPDSDVRGPFATEDEARDDYEDEQCEDEDDEPEDDLCARCGKPYTDGDADEDYCADCRKDGFSGLAPVE